MASLSPFILGRFGRLLRVFALALLAACGSAFANGFPVSEIASGVFVHQGRYEEISSANQGDIANVGFIVGTRCVAVIDAGASPWVGNSLRQAIKERTPVPICYVINTHMHPDHILGNSAFLPDKPVFIAHANYPAALAVRIQYYQRSLARNLGEAVPLSWFIPATRTVASALVLDLGGRKLRLVAHPTAHTNNDLTAYDDRTRTLWLSDLLFMRRVPSLDGSLPGWLTVLAGLEQERADRVVPGHGPVSAAWPGAAQDELRYLHGLSNGVRAVIKRGGTLEEALRTVGASERNRWLLFDDYNQGNVSKAFTELEWQ